MRTIHHEHLLGVKPGTLNTDIDEITLPRIIIVYSIYSVQEYSYLMSIQLTFSLLTFFTPFTCELVGVGPIVDSEIFNLKGLTPYSVRYSVR